jgi:pyrroline-5-carboxylate reductase
MGRALAGGLIAEGTAKDAIRVVEIAADARTRLQQELGIEAHDALRAADVEASDVVVLAVKPQVMRATARALAPLLEKQLVISIAAGIRIADLSRWLGGYARIVRAMPNTPALIRRGITGLFAAAGVNAEERISAEQVLGAVGETLWCDTEKTLDAITAVSGSGPAYLFHYLESMIAAAEDRGFSSADARRLAYATARGAVELALHSSDPPAVLREQVTSKGGTTAAALEVLRMRDVKAAYVEAIRAADARAAELGDVLGRDG